ncbi:MAG TPA: HEAT repeat domain-containing protein, partial [Longimicrobiaceae bacterium]|nr:HEAT repeat domain-containing protein [Longimicrobiaceae bacterium]
ETAVRPDVRRALETAVQRLADAHREQLVELLSDRDPAVVAGAARRVAELGIGSAAPELLRLLKHSEAMLRLAGVEALARLRAAVAGSHITKLLEDPDREVRVAAARALATLEFTAARTSLEAAVGSKRLRAADRSERVAFFEAYGRLAGAEGVQVLARILNGRGFLGRAGNTEERTCAALGLARARHPSARAALSAASNDGDPVVRTTVQRALREEQA